MSQVFLILEKKNNEIIARPALHLQDALAARVMLSAGLPLWNARRACGHTQLQPRKPRLTKCTCRGGLDLRAQPHGAPQASQGSKEWSGNAAGRGTIPSLPLCRAPVEEVERAVSPSTSPMTGLLIPANSANLRDCK